MIAHSAQEQVGLLRASLARVERERDADAQARSDSSSAFQLKELELQDEKNRVIRMRETMTQVRGMQEWGNFCSLSDALREHV
jgi:hypothetical protein